MQWRDVVGYEGHYQVSEYGDVRSLDRYVAHPRQGKIFIKGRMRKLAPSGNFGHLCVYLKLNGKVHNQGAHRLVLAAFVGPCPAEHEACHRDGNASNNHFSNLYWGTHSDNIQDAVRHGTHCKVRKNHCAHGHPFDEVNTYWCPRGTRQCRTCRKAQRRKCHRTKRSAA